MALSTTKAEYIDVAEALKEALWVKGSVEELEGKPSSIVVFCDSQAAIQLVKNPVYHERTKQIDVRLHFVRDVVSQGLIQIKKIATEDNPSDMLTKVLSGEKLRHCLSLIKVRKPP